MNRRLRALNTSLVIRLPALQSDFFSVAYTRKAKGKMCILNQGQETLVNVGTVNERPETNLNSTTPPEGPETRFSQSERPVSLFCSITWGRWKKSRERVLKEEALAGRVKHNCQSARKASARSPCFVSGGARPGSVTRDIVVPRPFTPPCYGLLSRTEVELPAFVI